MVHASNPKLLACSVMTTILRERRGQRTPVAKRKRKRMIIAWTM